MHTTLPAQLTLNLDQDLEGRYTSLRECVAARCYARGLKKAANAMDTSSSHLGEKLAGCDTAGNVRGVTLDEFENFLRETKDFEPLYYLVARFLRDRSAQQEAAQAKLLEIFERLGPLISQAGISKTGKARR